MSMIGIASIKNGRITAFDPMGPGGLSDKEPGMGECLAEPARSSFFMARRCLEWASRGIGMSGGWDEGDRSYHTTVAVGEQKYVIAERRLDGGYEIYKQ